MEVCITNFGGRIVSVMVPDKNGNMKDVVLGFDSIADYVNIPSDFGASIGRYAKSHKMVKLLLTEYHSIASKQFRTLFAQRSQRMAISSIRG